MLQTRTVEPGTLELLKQLMLLPVLESFFLVGGTAIGLQLGHRKSIDLDLFTAGPFNNSTLLEALVGKYEISVELEEPNFLITTIDGIKVDFVKMGYPILFPTLLIEGVRMLDLRDIAAMKLKAIAQRGSKKDFFDIHFLLDQMSLETMISMFRQKFKMHEVFHIVKSLTYFEDAEESANPVVFDKTVTWQIVKGSIKSAVKNLGNQPFTVFLNFPFHSSQFIIRSEIKKVRHPSGSWGIIFSSSFQGLHPWLRHGEQVLRR